MSYGLYMKYFVLKPKGDDDYAIASQRAMIAYAEWIGSHGDETLAREVRNWAEHEQRATMREREL